jgi:hypothetical protein
MSALDEFSRPLEKTKQISVVFLLLDIDRLNEIE